MPTPQPLMMQFMGRTAGAAACTQDNHIDVEACADNNMAKRLGEFCESDPLIDGGTPY